VLCICNIFLDVDLPSPLEVFVKLGSLNSSWSYSHHLGFLIMFAFLLSPAASARAFSWLILLQPVHLTFAAAFYGNSAISLFFSGWSRHQRFLDARWPPLLGVHYLCFRKSYCCFFSRLPQESCAAASFSIASFDEQVLWYLFPFHFFLNSGLFRRFRSNSYTYKVYHPVF
jgi:hypothetical protein